MKLFKINKKETILYAIAGALSASVNLGVFFTLKDIIGLNYLFSNVIAWMATVIVAYFGDKIFVFKTEFGKALEILKEFSKFFYGRLISFTVDMSLLWFLVDTLRFNSDLAKLLNSVVVITINYAICKLLVFKA